MVPTLSVPIMNYKTFNNHSTQSNTRNKYIHFSVIRAFHSSTVLKLRLWESTVKSFKHDLKHVSSNGLFTYEEFNTFITQVEFILNSRYLQMSSDPNDLQVLTPGHFLRPLTKLPKNDFSNTPTNRLSFG